MESFINSFNIVCTFLASPFLTALQKLPQRLRSCSFLHWHTYSGKDYAYRPCRPCRIQPLLFQQAFFWYDRNTCNKLHPNPKAAACNGLSAWGQKGSGSISDVLIPMKTLRDLLLNYSVLRQEQSGSIQIRDNGRGISLTGDEHPDNHTLQKTLQYFSCALNTDMLKST